MDDLSQLSDEELQSQLAHLKAADIVHPQADLSKQSDDELRQGIEMLRRQEYAPRLQRARQQVDIDEQQRGTASFSHQTLRSMTDPFLGGIKTVAYGKALNRLREGQPDDTDLQTITRYEKIQDELSKEGVGASTARTIASLPAHGMMFYLGGVGAGAATRAAGYAPRAMQTAYGMPTLGGVMTRAAGEVPEIAAMTVATPHLYFGRAAQENIKQGRDPLNPAAFPGAIAHAGVLNLALAGVGKAADALVPAQGLAGAAGRVATEAAIGVPAQAVGDVVTSALGLDTGYGLFGELYEGKYGDALKNVVNTAVMFGAFKGSKEFPKLIAERLSESAKQGKTPDEAAKEIAPLLEQAKAAQEAKPPDAAIKEAGAVESPVEVPKEPVVTFTGPKVETPTEVAPPVEVPEVKAEAKPTERQQKALELRDSGKTLKQVADELGVSTTTAMKDVRAARLLTGRIDQVGKTAEVVPESEAVGLSTKRSKESTPPRTADEVQSDAELAKHLGLPANAKPSEIDAALEAKDRPSKKKADELGVKGDKILNAIKKGDFAFSETAAPIKFIEGVSYKLAEKILRSRAGGAVYDYATFAKEAVAKFGEEVKQYLKAIWDMAQTHVTPEEKTYGVKNKWTYEQFEEMQLGTPTHGPKVSYEESADRAKSKLAADPFAGAKLVDSLERKPRFVTTDEQVMLMTEAKRLSEERAQAQNRLDNADTTSEKIEAQKAVDAARTAFKRAGDVWTIAGTTPAQSLGVRRFMIKEDLSLAQMERDAYEARGGSKNMTDAERTTFQEEIATKNQQLKDLQDKAETAEKALADYKSSNKSEVRKSDRTKAELKAAWEKFQNVSGGLYSLEAVPKNAVAFADVIRTAIKHGIAKVEDVIQYISEFNGRPVSKELEDSIRGGWDAVHREMANQQKGTTRTGRAPLTQEKRREVAIKNTKKAIESLERQKAAGQRDVKAKPDPIIDAELQELQKKRDFLNKELDLLEEDKSPAQKKTNADRLALKKEQVQKKMEKVREEIKNKKREEKDPLDPLKKDLELERMEENLASLTDLRDKYLPEKPDPYADPKKEEAKKNALTQDIIELNEQINAKEKNPTPDKTADTEEIRRLRELRDMKQEVLDTVVEASPEDIARREKARDQAITRGYERRAEAYEKKQAAGDYSTPTKVERELSDDAVNARAKFEMARSEWLHGLEKDRRANLSMPGKAWATTKDGLDLGRALILGLDLPPMFRQGLFYTAWHPIKSMRAMVENAKAFKDPEVARRSQIEIESRPLFEDGTFGRMGLDFFSTEGDLINRAEEYRSHLIKKIPVYAGLERWNTAYQNRIKADWAELLYKTLSKRKGATDNDLKMIGNYVNVMTGRGQLGRKGKGALGAMADVFLAPAYVVSRFQAALGQPLWHRTFSEGGREGSGQVRMMLAKEYAGSLIGIAGAITMAKLALGDDLKIEWDPRATRFGVTIGNTHIDPTAGVKQAVTLLFRLGRQSTKNAKGEIKPLSDVKFGQDDAWDVTADFARKKFAPAPAAFFDWATEKNVVGGKVTTLGSTPQAVKDIAAGKSASEVYRGFQKGPQSAILGMFTPISPGDVIGAMEDLGVPKGTAASIWALFGGGVNTYTPKKK